MNLIKYINQPFPKAENKWNLVILISLFVALFLIIFQPFGITLMESKNKYLILSGYGLVTFIALFINLIIIENLFRKIFNEKSWTIWKEFAWLIWVIFSIGIGNALYTIYLIDYFEFGFRFFVTFQFFTIVIGLIPVTVLIITKQKYLLKNYLNSANDFNKSLDQNKSETITNQIIRFYADNEKDFIEFDTNDFYYIESSGNYIELYIYNENKIIRKTYRSTLKRTLEYFTETPEIIQCHRAFIVNANKIISAKGNSQGLRLNLENCNNEIPVSRGYINAVRNMIT